MLDGSSSGGGAGNGGGGKVTFAKKVPVKRKEEKKVVVDDWEAAELAEEAREGEGGIKLEGSLPISEGEASDVVADTQALEAEVVVPVVEVTDGDSVEASDPVASVLEPAGATMEAEAQPTTLMADVEDSTAGEPKLDWAGEVEEAANGQS
jgi:transcriptional repressor NF-X1